MKRILADLPDDDVKWLDQVAAEQGKSRASVLRDAVSTYRVQASGNLDWIDRGYGLWAHRDDIGDGVDYQRAIREDRRAHEEI
jgi:hypothetical protein